MKAIIIDDEKRARLSLSLLLEEYCPQVKVVADCGNLPEGVKAIRRHQPDVVFLDIEMPGHSGLELLEFFDEDEVNFSIIFATAYNEYAIRAFRFSAMDYLLKPIVPDELVQAVERTTKFRMKQEAYQHLKVQMNENKWDRIAVPSANLLLFLDIVDILYIKGDGAYSEVIMNDGTKHVVSRNLKNFEEILCENPAFVRAHKSYIVNLKYVKAFNKSDGGSLDLQNGMQIPVSSDKSALILDKIRFIKR